MRTKTKNQQFKMLGIGLLSILLLASCQQEELSDSPASGEEKILSSAGAIHNEIVSYYYANRIIRNAPTELIISEVIDLSWDYLEKNGYDTREIEEAKLLIGERFKSTSLKSLTTDGYSIDPDRLVPRLEETKLYSKAFSKEVINVLNLVYTQGDRHILKEYVNSVFSHMEFSTPADQAGQHLFVDIFNKSFEFWEMHEESSLKSLRLKDSSKVIINDAVGAIIGTIFGPIGSIVTGAVFSIGTNEELKDK